MPGQKGWTLFFISFLTGCSITPKPATLEDRYAEAQKDIAAIFHNQEKMGTHLDFYEAMARGFRHNLDYRIKLTNNALQMGQLKLAEFAMFPALNATGSLYTRSNDLSSSSVTNSGEISDISNSTPRTLLSERVEINWNVLDFGLNYVKARQQADRQLIAKTEAHRQMQQLAQDVLTAYWEAYSAQELILHTHEFQKTLKEAAQQMESAIRDKTIPQENILHYREALLNGERHLLQLRFKYDKALYDLKHLLSLPLEAHFKLDPPPAVLFRAPDLKNINFRKLDAITLVRRPELEGQHYQEQIAKLGVRAAILQALPGLTLNEGWNYNSNKFLLNAWWIDRSANLAWNLINLASLPTSIHSAKDQIAYERMKKMAMTLGVLTETRYAFSHYQSLRSEYGVAQKQTENANAIYTLEKNRHKASLTSTQQVLMAEIQYLTAQMDRDLLMSDLSKSSGELYLSSGYDILPTSVADEPLDVIIKKVKRSIALRNQMDLTDYVEITYHRLFGEVSQDPSHPLSPGLATLPDPWHSGLPLPLSDSSKYDSRNTHAFSQNGTPFHTDSSEQ